MNQQNKPAEQRVCLNCGVTRTAKGQPITKKYCSPTCMRAHVEEWESEHGSHATYGKQGYLLNSDDY